MGISMRSVQAVICDTGDRNEDVEPGLQVCISNQGHDGFVYGLDLAFDLPEPVCVLFLQKWVGKVLSPVLRGRPALDEGQPRQMQLFKSL